MTAQTTTSTYPIVRVARAHRIEVKYGLLAIALLGGLVMFSRTAPVMAVEQWVNHTMQGFITMGAVGVFLFAFMANAAYMVNIPYTFLMLIVAATYSTFADQLLLGVITGIGAMLGASVSYVALQQMVQSPETKTEGGIGARLERLIRERPRLAPAVVFAAAVTPLPDDPIYIYLALKRYPLSKLALPLLIGKVMHTLTLITLLDVFAPGQLEISFDSIFLLLSATLVFALYQSEKHRAISSDFNG